MLDALVLWYVFMGLVLAVTSPWWKRPAPPASEPAPEPESEPVQGEDYDEVFVPGDRVYVRIGKGVLTRGRIVAIAGPIDGTYRIVVRPHGCPSVVMADPEDIEDDEDDDNEEQAVGYRESSNKDLN